MGSKCEKFKIAIVKLEKLTIYKYPKNYFAFWMHHNIFLDCMYNVYILSYCTHTPIYTIEL